MDNWDASEEAAAYKLQEHWPLKLCNEFDCKHNSPLCLSETSFLFQIFHEYPKLLRSSQGWFLVMWPHSLLCLWFNFIAVSSYKLLLEMQTAKPQKSQLCLTELLVMLQRLLYCFEIWVLMGEVFLIATRTFVLICPCKAVQQDGPVVQNRLSQFDWRLKDLLNLRIHHFSELV